MAPEEGSEDPGGGGEETPTRPEYLPEKFWNAETNEVNLEGLTTSYGALEKKLGTTRADVRKEVEAEAEAERAKNRPATPEDYRIALPEGTLPGGVTFEADDGNPMLEFWRGFAYEHGLTDEMFNKGVAAYAKALTADLPDNAAELEKLGEKGAERADTAHKFLKGNLTAENFEALDGLVDTAAGVEAVEQLMKLAKGPNIGRNNENETGETDGLTIEKLREMVRDVRYWQLKDPVFVRQVDDGFKKLYPSTTETAHRGPSGARA